MGHTKEKFAALLKEFATTPWSSSSLTQLPTTRAYSRINIAREVTFELNTKMKTPFGVFIVERELVSPYYWLVRKNGKVIDRDQYSNDIEERYKMGVYNPPNYSRENEL